MTILHVDEIRKMGKEERLKKITELKTELSKLMSTRAMGGSMENPARIRLIRKTIAKFKTVSREEELGIKRQLPEKKEKAKEKEAEKAKKAAKPAEKKAKKKAEPVAEETEDEEDEE